MLYNSAVFIWQFKIFKEKHYKTLRPRMTSVNSKKKAESNKYHYRESDYRGNRMNSRNKNADIDDPNKFYSKLEDDSYLRNKHSFLGRSNCETTKNFRSYKNRNGNLSSLNYSHYNENNNHYQNKSHEYSPAPYFSKRNRTQRNEPSGNEHSKSFCFKRRSRSFRSFEHLNKCKNPINDKEDKLFNSGNSIYHTDLINIPSGVPNTQINFIKKNLLLKIVVIMPKMLCR